jgi:hypothetical protein
MDLNYLDKKYTVAHIFLDIKPIKIKKFEPPVYQRQGLPVYSDVIKYEF